MDANSFVFTRHEKSVEFNCSRCERLGKKSQKVSKNVAVRKDNGDNYCNGCYGNVLSGGEN